MALNEPETVSDVTDVAPRVDVPADNPVGKAPVPPWNRVQLKLRALTSPLLSLPMIDAPEVQLLSFMVRPSSKSAFKLIHLAVDDVLIGGTVVAVDSNWNDLIWPAEPASMVILPVAPAFSAVIIPVLAYTLGAHRPSPPDTILILSMVAA